MLASRQIVQKGLRIQDDLLRVWIQLGTPPSKGGCRCDVVGAQALCPEFKVVKTQRNLTIGNSEISGFPIGEHQKDGIGHSFLNELGSPQKPLICIFRVGIRPPTNVNGHRSHVGILEFGNGILNRLKTCRIGFKQLQDFSTIGVEL